MRIVITGGTYSGKTSLINEFSKQGYETLPDVGLQVIEQLNNEIGIEKQREWRKQHPEEFYTKIAEKQADLESKLKQTNKPILFDRGLHDYAAFCKLIKIKIPQRILELMQKHTYDIAFLCETLQSFDNRTHTGRSLNKEDSLKLKQHIKEVYQQYGIKVVEFEDMTINQRIQKIKKHIELFLD